MANLTINGKTIDVDVEGDTPLLWAIRENVGLTGTKYGCYQQNVARLYRGL
jgi:isoquinoline 1-oxidoreductase alpha subunit